MDDQASDWKLYEQAAAIILNDLARHLSLDRVEGNQAIPGLRSKTVWKIESKGCLDGDKGFVIIECRRRNRKLEQEALGGLAYRISDTGAAGGAVVTPVGLQEGAEKIAKAEKITVVKLSEDSTPAQYAVEFLGKLFLKPRTGELRVEGNAPTLSITPAI